MTEIAAKPTKTTAASHTSAISPKKVEDSQFMLTSVTGRRVGKDKIGIARINHAIATLRY